MLVQPKQQHIAHLSNHTVLRCQETETQEEKAARRAVRQQQRTCFLLTTSAHILSSLFQEKKLKKERKEQKLQEAAVLNTTHSILSLILEPSPYPFHLWALWVPYPVMKNSFSSECLTCSSHTSRLPRPRSNVKRKRLKRSSSTLKPITMTSWPVAMRTKKR